MWQSSRENKSWSYYSFLSFFLLSHSFYLKLTPGKLYLIDLCYSTLQRRLIWRENLCSVQESILLCLWISSGNCIVHFPYFHSSSSWTWLGMPFPWPSAGSHLRLLLGHYILCDLFFPWVSQFSFPVFAWLHFKSTEKEPYSALLLFITLHWFSDCWTWILANERCSRGNHTFKGKCFLILVSVL